MDEGELKFVLTPSQLNDGVPVLSEHLTLQNLPWRLMMLSKDVLHNSQGNKGRTVGLYVQCVPDSPGSRVWSVSAHVKVKILNHINAEKSLTKVFDHDYSNTSTDWGFGSLMKWKDLTDPSRGFLKEGKVFVEAVIVLKKKSEGMVPSPPVLEMGGVVNTLLLCPNCAGEYQSKGERLPMSLKCGHTFCAVCLQKSSSKTTSHTTLKCPSCNQLHTSDSPDGAGLWFPNLSMVQIIENMLSKSKHFCHVHRHDKNFYCFDCRVLVCIYCAYHGKHSAHTCKHSQEAVKDADHTLRTLKLSTSSHVSEMERKLQFVRDERAMLKSQETSLKQMIENSYEQLKATLLRQKEMLFQEVEDHTSELDSGIDTNFKKLEEQYSKVKDTLSEFTAWQSLPEKEALEKFSDVQSSLSNIPTLCSSASFPQEHGLPTKMTFETSGLSDPLTFSRLGRLVVESGSSVESESKASVTTDPEGDLPPNKRRKKTL